MQVEVLKCPQCHAPLTPPSRFARSTVCAYCATTVQLQTGAVSARRFREALAEWDAPATHGYTRWWTVADAHWAPGPLLGRGEASDVYLAERARWPTERVLLKVRRNAQAAPEREWQVLEQLQERVAAEAPSFGPRFPQPVGYGVVRNGPFEGHGALVYRDAPGFVHTLEAVRVRYPRGVDPRAGVWLWRRLLETLTFLHTAGFAHGAVLPSHLLIQENEHGLRLVGFGCADTPGTRLRAVSGPFEDFYPRERALSFAADLAMSARCVAWVLGGEAREGRTPDSVPRPLAALLASVAATPAHGATARDAWRLREEVGRISAGVFGRPSFNPIRMEG